MFGQFPKEIDTFHFPFLLITKLRNLVPFKTHLFIFIIYFKFCIVDLKSLDVFEIEVWIIDIASFLK